MSTITEVTRRKVIIKCQAKCHFCERQGKIVSRYGKRCVVISDNAAVMDRIIEYENYNGMDVHPLEYHHVKPVFFGGTHDEENIVLACMSCNRTRGHLFYVHQWAREHRE